MKNSFTHLHVHSDYSLKDGMCKIDKLFDRAKEMGFKSLAITDHGNIDCYVNANKKSKECGVNYIPGVELYLVDNYDKPEKGIKIKRYHLILYAKNMEGLSEIFKIMGKANKEFYYKPIITLENLSKFNFKNIILTSACAGGILAAPDYKSKVKFILKNISKELYLEVMPHKQDYQIENCKRVLEISKKHKLTIIATNDCHYVNKGDHSTQEILLCINTNSKLSNPDRWKFDMNTLWLSSREELEQMFWDQDFFTKKQIKEFLNNTNKIENQIDYDSFTGFDDKIYAKGFNRNKFLDFILEKFEKFPFANKKVYRDRLEYEMDKIYSKGYDKYFFIVYDFINYARSKGIMIGSGRGSVGGSLLAYILEITGVDPIQFDLDFSRFISDDRIDLPDIDVDVEDERREEIMEYLRDKYGKNSVVNLSTFIDMKSKGVLRDVSRVCEIPISEVNEVSKSMDVFAFGDSRFEYIDLTMYHKSNEKMQEFFKKHKKYKEHFFKLEKVIKSVGIHAAGCVILKEDINKSGKGYIVKRNGRNVLNWDYKNSEYMGFVKFDILGLNNLTIISRTLKLIKERYNKIIELEKVDLNDKKVIKLFQDKDTCGVFQFAKPGMKRLIKDIVPENFNDLVALNALNRPGPLYSGMVEKFIDIRKGKDEPYYYDSDIIKKITGPTNSLILFQEQMIKILNSIGFSYTESDTIRKICAKSKGVEAMNEYKEKFLENAKRTGTLEPDKADELFEQMKYFGAYLFNKTHAVEYCLIAYYTAYLKTHYYNEYMQSLLSYSKDENRLKEFISDLEKRGYNFSKVDINISNAKEWVIKGDTVYLPFESLFGIADKTSSEMIRARNEVGEFKDKDHFLELVTKRIVNSKIVGILEKAKVFNKDDNEFEANLYRVEIKQFYGKGKEIEAIEKEKKRELKKINKEIIECNNCDIRRETSEPIKDNHINSNIVLLFDNPSKDKNNGKDTYAFNSYYGKIVFDRGLIPLGLNREDVTILNTVKCYPMESRNINDDCLSTCTNNFLDRQLKIIKPSIIMAFGKSSVKFLKKQEKVFITHECGEWEYNHEYDCITIYNVSPAYAKRQSELKDGRNSLTMFEESLCLLINKVADLVF